MKNINYRPDETDRYQILLQKLAENPALERKIDALAEHLAKNFNKTTHVLADIKQGTYFLDTETKDRYQYVKIMKPYQHSPLTYLTCKKAKEDLEILPSISYMHIRKANLVVKPNEAFPLDLHLGEHKVISADIVFDDIISIRDFCIYFTLGKWVLENPGDIIIDKPKI